MDVIFDSHTCFCAQVYYTTPAKKSEGVKGFWCHSCYNEHRGEVIELEGMRVRKVPRAPWATLKRDPGNPPLTRRPLLSPWTFCCAGDSRPHSA